MRPNVVLPFGYGKTAGESSVIVSEDNSEWTATKNLKDVQNPVSKMQVKLRAENTHLGTGPPSTSNSSKLQMPI